MGAYGAGLNKACSHAAWEEASLLLSDVKAAPKAPAAGATVLHDAVVDGDLDDAESGMGSFPGSVKSMAIRFCAVRRASEIA